MTCNHHNTADRGKICITFFLAFLAVAALFTMSVEYKATNTEHRLLLRLMRSGIEKRKTQLPTRRIVENYFLDGRRSNSTRPAPAVCWALQGDMSIEHPLQDNMNAITEYSLADLVKANTSSSAIWYRVRFAEDAEGQHFLDGCENNQYVQMTSAGQQRFCAALGTYSADLEPRNTCTAGVTRPPAIAYPYCNRETAPVAVVSLDCAIVESWFAAGVIIWNILTLDSETQGRVYTHNGPSRWAIPRHVPVTEHDELACAGTSVYPSAPGHFFNEILPRLIHLDAVLPTDIPLLWPDGALPMQILEILKSAGMCSSTRVFVPTGSPSLHRARRLYLYASDYGPGYTPLVLFVSQRLLQRKLHAYLRTLEADEKYDDGIVILSRGHTGHARSMQNEGELIAALRHAFPSRSVEAFEPGVTPGFSFMQVMLRVHQARVILGPHGANLNNILGARPGTVVVEFGYVGGMNMPSDYFCLARNLRLRYWLSPSLSGDYGSPMRVDVQDALDIIIVAADSIVGSHSPLLLNFSTKEHQSKK